MFYVYVILDPRKNGSYSFCGYSFKYEPIYIGKGKDNRMDFHLYESKLNSKYGNRLKNNTLKKILREGYIPIIDIVIDNLTEEDSFIIERELIDCIGRRDLGKGSLTNLTDGGEGHSGSSLFIGEKNPFYGRKHRHESFKNTSKPVYQLDMNGNIIGEFYSIEEAARRTNSIPCKISICAKGKRNTHNGYKWRYVDNDGREIKYGRKEKFDFILQKDMEGNIIRRWDKIIDIIENNSGYKKYPLINCLKKRLHGYKNHLWEYGYD